MTFYLIAIGIGVVLAGTWVGWLLAVRAFLHATKSAPGALLSIIQVVVVLALMLAAYHVSDWSLRALGIDTAAAPALMVKFRRIWIVVWALGMAASIQLFIDIRRMSTPPPSVRRPPRSAANRRPRR